MSKRSQASFLAGTLLYWVSLYLYVPTLPTFIYDKTLSLTVVGTVLSMYGLWQALVRIPVGIGVDATGRGKLFILVGFGFSAAGAIVMAFGGSVASLAFGRALTGFAAGTWVPLIAVFAGFFPPGQAVYATSLLTLSGSVGRMIATGMNGFLNNLGGYRLTFLLAAAAAVLAGFIIGNTRITKPESKGITLKSIASLFSRPDIMLPSIISLVVQFGTWAVTFGFLPILAEELGASDVALSLLISLNLAILTAGNLLNTLFAKKIRHVPVVATSIVFSAICISITALTGTLWLLFAASAGMGLANGFNYPTLMGLSISRVDSAHRSSAMGIHQSVYAIGMFSGPWLGGMIADLAGIRTMFLIVAGFVVVASALLIARYSSKTKATPAPDAA